MFSTKVSSGMPDVLRLGELFAGPGGLALGALRAHLRGSSKPKRFVHQWATDYDPDACATYRRNICPSQPLTVICEDVRMLETRWLPPIDAFAFGFPCNDFSVVGEQKGVDGEFGPLYSYGVRILNQFRPKVFVAENVGGLQSSNEGNAFIRILSDLRRAGPGYKLTPHLYRFEDYGVPQTRHRILIVGIAEPLGLVFRVPAPTTLGNPLTAAVALSKPAIPEDAPNHERTTQSPTVVERLSHIQPGQNAWDSDLPDRLQLNVKGARLSMIYRRLHPDKPAYTVTGSGGGGTHIYHWAEPRALTNRERARLQTFPDDFVFVGQKGSVRKQIGMAVPPNASKLVFEAILRTLAGIPYPSVPANLQSVLDKVGAKRTVQTSLSQGVRSLGPAALTPT